MLRGPQTPGELKQRTERLHPLADLSAVLDALERLIERELAVRLPRRPGQKEERYAHLLGDDDAAAGRAGAPAAPAPPGAAATMRPAARAGAAPVARGAPPPPRRRPIRASGGWRTSWPRCAPTSTALRATVDALRAELGA